MSADRRMCRRVLAVLVAVLAVVAVGVAPAGAQTPPASRAAPPVDPPVLDGPLGEAKEVRGTRGVRSYEPNPASVLLARSSLEGTSRWAIVAGRRTITLLRGTTTLRRVPRPGRGAITLPELTAAIDDPRWVEEVDDGVFVLRAGLAHGAGTTLRIAGPRVAELRLADRPHVFLVSANGARATIADTRVVGWDERRGAVDTDHELSRPFILATFGARLDVRRSEIAYLGYNRGSAYGLSWREQGATGSVVDSDVHHLFFGMYSYEAEDITLRNSQWHHCVYYGIDPHDYTTGMVVEGNESYANGSHGIIFSTGVTGGVVRRNVVHGNGGNGIVMDFRSDDARIADNVVRDNDGDGVVILGSSNTTVERNTVSGNRVGLRVNLPSQANALHDNEVVGNEVGAQVYGGARDTTLRDNAFRGSVDTGVIVDGAGTRLDGGVVAGGSVGVDVRGIGTVVGVRITDVTRGVNVRSTGILRADDVDVSASQVGVVAAPDALTRVVGSQVVAPEPLRGTFTEDTGNRTVVPWSSAWLVLAGLSFLVIALVLHVLNLVRNRGHRPGRRGVATPPGVTNAR